MTSIKVAIVGIGNCASSLVQGVAYYRREQTVQGMIQPVVGGYAAADVEFVLGFDVDARKVGLDIAEAIFAGPNNTKVFCDDVPLTGAKVLRGNRLDGVAGHMTMDSKRGVVVDEGADASREQVVAALRDSGAQVLVNFLPVGSHAATEFYMDCALEAGVAVVNCIPVFIASDSAWEARFAERGLPIVGDDIKAQVGATIVHRTLASLFGTRGVEIDRTYQLNTGGNTDFLNMMDRSRISSKKESKTQAVQAALSYRLADQDIVIGPSDYVPWQADNKVCFLRIEGEQFGGVPMNLEMRLSVEDSPNAAACVVDAIRFCRVAMEQGKAGSLIAPSALYCKHPPQQIPEEQAEKLLDAEFGSFSCAAE